MMEKQLMFSDDLSESAPYDSPEEEIHHDIVNQSKKPMTAPQFQRTPVFTYKNGNEKTKYPSRPSTSNRPSSRPSSRKHRTQSPPSLENRILIKLANILPNGETEATNLQTGRLPESRNTLLKLNAELDDMVKDIRELNTEHGKYLMANLYDQLKDTLNDSPTINVETGHILYDIIISELTNQAYKKIMRINKFYRHHLVLQRNQHQQEKQSFILQIEELKSQLHSQQLMNVDKLTTNDDDLTNINSNRQSIQKEKDLSERISSPSPSNRSERSPSPKQDARIPQRRAAVLQSFNAPTSSSDPNKPVSPTESVGYVSQKTQSNTVNYDEFVREQTNYAIQENAKKLEQLHVFVMRTLEHERKIALQKINHLTEVLTKSQKELHDARKEIVELKDKLFAKEENQLKQDDKVLTEMNEVLKTLLAKRKTDIRNEITTAI